MTITATMHVPDRAHDHDGGGATRGSIRVDDVFDTDLHDLWDACTTPDRLARWIATVDGEPRVGGTVEVVFTSTWSGPVRIDACDAPHHLLLTEAAGTDDETQIEAWLTAEASEGSEGSEGPRTRLVVEERGLPAGQLHFHGAGWQVHLEDLARSLVVGGSVHPTGWSAEAPAPAWVERWQSLTPEYAARIDATTR